MIDRRVVIVDDEPMARVKLRRFVEEDRRACVVAEAGDGLEAVRVIETERPDLVLLDIQMPEIDGFQVLQALEMERLPAIVFVTAHDQHAVRAFEVRALDYLLKPVDRDRLRQALDRVFGQPLVEGPRAGDPRSVLTALPPERQVLERFLVRSRGRMLLVSVDQVDWIGAAGNYAELHIGAETYLVRSTLQQLEAGLPKRRFPRIHRSAIVNLDRVKELRDSTHGDLAIVLENGIRLRLSRRYRHRLEGVLGM